MKNPFTYIKSMPGLKSGNVRIVIGLALAVSLAAIIYVLQADNLSGNGGNDDSDKKDNTLGTSNASTINQIASTAPDTSPIIPTNESSSNKENASDGTAVPPIVPQQYNSPTNQQQQANDPDVEQVKQIRQQAQQKKLQAYYNAYGAKTVTTSPNNPAKANSSTPITSGNTIGNTESDNLVNDTNSPYLGSELLKPKSDYLVQAGSLIPAVMISGLNSDINGQVIAQVRENVYDSASGRYLLIPQGSKLVGQFSNQVAYGQERISVAWQRVIYPNGYSWSLKGIPGSSVDGFSGFYDQVDNHYWRIFGASFVMGVITAGMQYSQNNTSTTSQMGGYYNPTIGQTMAGSLGQQLGQTGMMITQKNLNIAPTITIRQGYKFTIMMTADVDLKPYKQGK